MPLFVCYMNPDYRVLLLNMHIYLSHRLVSIAKEWRIGSWSPVVISPAILKAVYGHFHAGQKKNGNKCDLHLSSKAFLIPRYVFLVKMVEDVYFIIVTNNACTSHLFIFFGRARKGL